MGGRARGGRGAGRWRVFLGGGGRYNHNGSRARPLRPATRRHASRVKEIPCLTSRRLVITTKLYRFDAWLWLTGWRVVHPAGRLAGRLAGWHVDYRLD